MYDKHMKLQILIEDSILNKIDVECTSKGYTRSEFVREAIRQKLFPISSSLPPFKGEPTLPDMKDFDKTKAFQELKEQLTYSKEDI